MWKPRFRRKMCSAQTVPQIHRCDQHDRSISSTLQVSCALSWGLPTWIPWPSLCSLANVSMGSVQIMQTFRFPFFVLIRFIRCLGFRALFWTKAASVWAQDGREVHLGRGAGSRDFRWFQDEGPINVWQKKGLLGHFCCNFCAKSGYGSTSLITKIGWFDTDKWDLWNSYISVHLLLWCASFRVINVSLTSLALGERTERGQKDSQCEDHVFQQHGRDWLCR